MATSRTESSGLTRRQFLPVLGGAAVAAAAPRTLAAAPGGQPGKPPTAEARFVYVGTYTAPGVPPGGTHPSTALGIYVFRMDPHDGDLTPIQLVTNGVSESQNSRCRLAHRVAPLTCRTAWRRWWWLFQ